MPRETSFAILYQKLLDACFEPDPAREEATLYAVLRQLSAGEPPEKPKKNLQVPVENAKKLW